MYAWAKDITRIGVLTGAGISTDSGLPDYRGPQGVWTRDPSLSGAFTRKDFLADPGNRHRFWQAFAALHGTAYEPNAAHRALADLERSGKAVRVLTQNIDGLHQKAGSAPRKVLELHGSLATSDCLTCGANRPTAEILDRVAEGETDPSCPCGGILQPSIVMFGQYLDPDTISRARAVAAHSELFLAVGTSLLVEPAAGLCLTAVEAGAKLVIVNRDPTPYDGLATDLVRTPIGTALPQICAALA